MGDVHLDVFLDYLVKGRLRHPIYRRKRIIEIEHGGEAKTAFCDVDSPHLTSKVVDILEKLRVNLRKTCKRPDFEFIGHTALEELERSHLAELLLLESHAFLVFEKIRLECPLQVSSKARRDYTSRSTWPRCERTRPAMVSANPVTMGTASGSPSRMIEAVAVMAGTR